MILPPLVFPGYVSQILVYDSLNGTIVTLVIMFVRFGIEGMFSQELTDFFDSNFCKRTGFRFKKKLMHWKETKTKEKYIIYTNTHTHTRSHTSI
jgi:hypothetical protein